MKSASKPNHLSAKISIAILIVVLAVLSFLSVLLFGKSCTLEFHVSDPEQVSVVYDTSILKCTSQQITDNTLFLDFTSLSPGTTDVKVGNLAEGSAQVTMLYVHPTGIITIDTYFGKCRGDIAFSCSVSLILLVLSLHLWRRYRESTREVLCRYGNIRLLGALIFVGFTFLQQISSLIELHLRAETPSVLNIIEQTMLSAHALSFLLLPVSVIISLAISISNIILLKREGFRLTNMLGVFLGLVLCVGTLAPYFVYPLMEKLGFDVHRYSSTAVLASDCIEDIIATYMGYLECILLGTSISAVRAARHIPAFDKDYILILGCMITKDGGLTKLLQSRTDRAIEFARMQKEATGKELTFVPSGGKGDDEVIAEAEAIRNYLVSKGIPEEQILVENRSQNTRENLRFSYALIQEHTENAKIAFSTTNYHVFRAGCLAQDAGIPMEGIGARTKTYFWINAFIREFIATLHNEKRFHIRMLLLILCCMIPLEIFIYVSYLY